MISCAAIQKLERYGQLGQKRRSVEDFVQSSLKDPKRGNVYALTHMSTWRACLAALTDDSVQVKEERNVEDNNDNTELYNSDDGNETTTSIRKSMTVISDSLIYAMSFATALVAYHMDEQREKEEQQREKEKRSELDSLDGKVFGSRLSEAAELLKLLQEVSEVFDRHIHHRNDGSSVITQALAHLLSTSSDAALIATVLRHSGNKDMETERNLLDELCRCATSLVIATAAQLRIAQARQPSNTLYVVRPCPTLLHQLLSKTKGNMSNTAMTTGVMERVKCDGAFNLQKQESNAIVTRRIAEWAAFAQRGGLISLLAPFTLFQKLSLIDAVVAESPSSCCCMEITSYRRLLAFLLSSVACNRATCAVVYFRGDDIKLMQHNVRDSAEYALHTHVTTTPSEEGMLRSVAQLPVAQQQHGALLLAQWMASISFFFRSFCAEQGWTVFAQQQRRMVVLQESQERSERRRRKTAGGKLSAGNSLLQGNTADRMAYEGNNVRSDDSVNHMNEHNEMDERGSFISQQSAFSISSRASMISAMSKSSMASYRTFLSVIDATRGENGEEQAESKLYMHQSEDGNTNLPLILLEEVILALQRFVNVSNDDGVCALLNNFDLSALAWRTIGELYMFVQSTIKATPSSDFLLTPNSASAHSEAPPVFHFGHDIRYNKGLGYEVLGLLFAKVVLPNLHIARSESEMSQRCVEQALACCLSAYEVIAPQVIDQNVPAILRVAAHVVKDVPKEQNRCPETSATKEKYTIVHEFLISLLIRLGKSNQIPVLLNSIVSHLRKETDTPQETEMCNENYDETITAGLHEIFSHSRVRTALVQACGMSLDPEELLVHLLTYVSRWTSEEDQIEQNNENNNNNLVIENKTTLKSMTTELSQLLPQEAVFLLDILATVMEGIVATSITASALLERAAELELTLSTFLVNRLYKVFFTEEEEENGHSSVVSRTIFADGNVVRKKMQQRLMLYTLHAIYQSRELIFSCLQDLGIQNVEDYLRMLEETMWQVQTRVGSLVGPLTIDDLDATMSFTTQMRHAPYVHCATLLPQLALQRLTLASSVSVALNIAVSPAKESRRMVAFVLSYMRFASDGGLIPDGETTRALDLANRLTEKEWRCIVQFGSPRRVRQTLVWLLRLSFATPSIAWRSPCWLARCLTCCAGFLLDALCEVIMSVTDDEVLACCEHVKKDEEGEQATLVQLCAALVDVLRRLGHIPQWPLLLQRAVHWVLLLTQALEDATVLGENGMNKKKRNNKRGKSSLELGFLQIIMDFLSCESGVHSLFRHVLFGSKGTHSMWSAKRKNGRDRGDVNEAFVETIRVPFIPSTTPFNADVSTVTQNNNNNNTNNDNNKNEYDGDVPKDGGNDSSAIAKQTTSACTLLVEQIFSKEFAIVLVRQCGKSETSTCAANILCHLYTVALTVCRKEKTVSEGPSCAHVFALTVVDVMRHDCCKANFTGLSAFLSAMNGRPIIFLSSPHTSKSEEATCKRHRRESNELQSSQVTIAIDKDMGNHGKRLKNEKENSEKMQLHNVSQQWVELLGTLFVQVVENINVEINEGLLRAFTALFISLERVYVLGVMSTATSPTSVREHHHQRQDFERIYKSLAATVITLPHISTTTASMGLCELFAPKNTKTRRRSICTLVRLLSSGNNWALRALWVLYILHDELHHNVVNKESSVSGISSSYWFATVLSHFDPRQDYSTDNEAINLLLLNAEDTEAVQCTQRSFTLIALQKQHVHKEEKTTRWLMEQLRIMPSILHVFPNTTAPALLQQYMHALLHETVPVSFSSLSSSSSSSLSTTTSSECWKRYEGLLITACKSLHELSLVPHMRFSMWRGDVKRLLVASGTNILLSMGTKALWCHVLEICALPLPTLHDDDSFIDHELNFIQLLLCETRHVSHMEEKMMLCILRLLTRTLLPLGVLWRRSHLLPALMSALFTRCLNGVSLGFCSRVVLNQLSSFFFQLVKDASYVNNNNTHIHNRDIYISTSLKQLCLASITSCLFRQSVNYIDVFTTHSNDLDFFAADFLKALQRIHLPHRRTLSSLFQQQRRVWSDATLCDLSYACVGNDDGQSLLRQAAERMEEEEGNGERHIFIVPT